METLHHMAIIDLHVILDMSCYVMQEHMKSFLTKADKYISVNLRCYSFVIQYHLSFTLSPCSTLERLLDSILQEEEDRQPLRLPSPADYW